jgi:ketosteroid isomerase-like protein
MSQDNVEIVRQVYAAAARRDTPMVLTLYDAEVELDPSRLQFAGLPGGDAGIYRGHEGLRSFFREWHEAWGVIEYDFEELIDAGGGRNQTRARSSQRGRGRTAFRTRLDAPREQGRPSRVVPVALRSPRRRWVVSIGRAG